MPQVASKRAIRGCGGTLARLCMDSPLISEPLLAEPPPSWRATAHHQIPAIETNYHKRGDTSSVEHVHRSFPPQFERRSFYFIENLYFPKKLANVPPGLSMLGARERIRGTGERLCKTIYPGRALCSQYFLTRTGIIFFLGENLQNTSETRTLPIEYNTKESTCTAPIAFSSMIHQFLRSYLSLNNCKY